MASPLTSRAAARISTAIAQPGTSPPVISVGAALPPPLAQEVDTRTLRRPDAPACVHRGAAARCKSAIEITLSQLGAGGWWIILATVMLFPDWLFRWFGLMIWAVNKDGSRKLGYAS